MNILNVAEMVGNLLVAEVAPAVIAVERINAYLPAELHLRTDVPGVELLVAFGELPVELQEPLKSQMLLSDDEVDRFVDCVTQLRDTARDQLTEFNDTAGSVGGFFSVASTVIALAYVLIYVFQVMVDGDQISGAMYNLLVYLFQNFNTLIGAAKPV